MSVNTTITYYSQTKSYVMYCIAARATLLPASDEVLHRFVIFMSQIVNPESLKNYLSAVRMFHLDNGFEWKPAADRFLLTQALRGLKKTHGSAPDRKLPITPEHLMAMALMIEGTLLDISWFAATLLAFFLMLRKDNVSVAKPDRYNPRTGLARSDFALPPGYTWDSPDIPFIWVSLRHSKTNQFAAKTHTVHVVAIHGHPLCAVTAIQRCMLMNAAAPLSAQAFSIPKEQGDGRVIFEPMTHSVYVSTLKKYLVLINIDPTKYSGHSLRRGGATFGCSLTEDHSQIKFIGDWLSDCYMQYNARDIRSMLKLPALMSDAVRGLNYNI
jgi:hypothetical protein